MRGGNVMCKLFLSILCAGTFLLLSEVAGAQTKAIALDAFKDATARNVKAEPVTYRDQRALRVIDAMAAGTANDADRLLILSGTEFQDGMIEIELAGAPGAAAGEGARGFVGVAFHVSPDANRFECFYLRPTNGRADDQVRRNHSTQYISHPEYPWQRLRKEFPEKYESYVDLVPGAWTKVKIEVRGTQARLYVHGADQPVLIVNDLKLPSAKGPIGLWVGPATVAHFTNLRITN